MCGMWLWPRASVTAVDEGIGIPCPRGIELALFIRLGRGGLSGNVKTRVILDVTHGDDRSSKPQ